LGHSELAFQIADQFRVLGKSINLKDLVVVGGLGVSPDALQRPSAWTMS